MPMKKPYARREECELTTMHYVRVVFASFMATTLLFGPAFSQAGIPYDKLAQKESRQDFIYKPAAK